MNRESNRHGGCSRAMGFSLVEIMILVALIGLLATIAIPNFVRARLKSQQSTCISNLRLLESAKQNWSVETRAAQTAMPVLNDIQPYLDRVAAGKVPICPADTSDTFASSYRLNNIETPPTCRINPGTSGDWTGHHLE